MLHLIEALSQTGRLQVVCVGAISVLQIPKLSPVLAQSKGKAKQWQIGNSSAKRRVRRGKRDCVGIQVKKKERCVDIVCCRKWRKEGKDFPLATNFSVNCPWLCRPTGAPPDSVGPRRPPQRFFPLSWDCTSVESHSNWKGVLAILYHFPLRPAPLPFSLNPNHFTLPLPISHSQSSKT